MSYLLISIFIVGFFGFKLKRKLTVVSCYYLTDDKVWFAETADGNVYRWKLNEWVGYHNRAAWYSKSTGKLIESKILLDRLNDSKRAAGWDDNYWLNPKYVHRKILHKNNQLSS